VETTAPTPNPITAKLWHSLKVVGYVFGALVLFLFSIDLMVSSLQYLATDVIDVIIQATSNPFTGLFIGLLITAIIQSSSTTTAIVVTLVASGSLTLQTAIPIIMGANVGTTITSTIVSLGFINKRKEFRRALAAGTYHCFFNLLTVIILFPLEYFYGFLSFLSTSISVSLFTPTTTQNGSGEINHLWSGFNSLINLIVKIIPNGFILILLAFILLFGSILLFRKLVSDLLKANSPRAFSRFFFKNQFKSFCWGLLTTAAIRSSTITTSVVVPIVAKKIAHINKAAPFIMGANIGTTVTAFFAATLHPNPSSAIGIAIAHFLFNLIGVIIFFPIKILQRIPVEIANAFARVTMKNRFAGFVFILMIFFFIPFSLIYISNDATLEQRLLYERTYGHEKSYYHIISRINTRSKRGDWKVYPGMDHASNERPQSSCSVTERNNSFSVGNDMYPFSAPGFCWEVDNPNKYLACVAAIIPQLSLGSLRFDSVYVFTVQYNPAVDSLVHKIYVSRLHNIIIKREYLTSKDSVLRKEELIHFEVP
jgi:sodium-dependent phosphate cotransporter